MQLQRVEISNFKSISVSSPISIEPGITCLVGKNESGKTAVLQSLYRLKPLARGHATNFDALRDYPRRLYGRDKSTIDGKNVVETLFRLTDAEITAIEGEFGAGVITAIQQVSKGYDNKRTWSPGVDHERALANVSNDPRVKALGASGSESQAELYEIVKTAAAQNDDLSEIEDRLAEPLRDQLYSKLAAQIPTFLYFSDYDVLPGQVSIRRLQTVDEAELEPGERTALSLLRLAGVESDEFTHDSYEARKAALEAAANTLTDEVFEYWSQNKNLEVELDIEFRTEDENGTALTTPDPWLQVRIRNSRHRVTLNFSERSKGFVWFFSFLAYFSEYRGSSKQLVLLLDEPGLNLHGSAQEDLLRFIEERLSENGQIIYTTHSPFMIDPLHLERARLVEDVDGAGTVVSDDALGTSSETQFPIHAAIGIRATQTLFVGEQTLIVEGGSDLLYLQVMSERLKAMDRVGLDDRWTIVPVGGLDKMPTFIALLHAQLSIVAVHDSPSNKIQRLQDLVDKGVFDAGRLLPLAQFVSGAEADIEDLFEASWYLKLLDLAGVCTIDKVGDLKSPKGRIVKRVEATLGGEYSHYAPARYLASNRDLAEGVSSAVIDRFEKLFSACNKLLT